MACKYLIYTHFVCYQFYHYFKIWLRTELNTQLLALLIYVLEINNNYRYEPLAQCDVTIKALQPSSAINTPLTSLEVSLVWINAIIS